NWERKCLIVRVRDADSRSVEMGGRMAKKKPTAKKKSAVKKKSTVKKKPVAKKKPAPVTAPLEVISTPPSVGLDDKPPVCGRPCPRCNDPENAYCIIQVPNGPH